MTGDDAINKPADTARGADNAIRSQLRASASSASGGASAGARAAPGNLPAPDISRPAATGPSAANGGGNAAPGNGAGSANAIRGEQPGNALNPDLVATTQEAGNPATSDSGNGERARERAEAEPAGQQAEEAQGDLRQRAAPFRYGFVTGNDAPVSGTGNYVPLASGLADDGSGNSARDQLIRESRPQLFAVGSRVDLQAVQQGINGIIASLTGREPTGGDGELGETQEQTSARQEIEDELDGKAAASADDAAEPANDAADSGAQDAGPSLSERLEAIFGEAVARYDSTAQALGNGNAVPSVGLELTG